MGAMAILLWLAMSQSISDGGGVSGGPGFKIDWEGKLLYNLDGSEFGRKHHAATIQYVEVKREIRLFPCAQRYVPHGDIAQEFTVYPPTGMGNALVLWLNVGDPDFNTAVHPHIDPAFGFCPELPIPKALR